MILNSSRTKIVSSYGWEDKGEFSIVDVRDRSVTRFNLENAKYIRVKNAQDNHFVCLHYLDGRKLIITIQSFDNPSKVKGRIEIKDGHSIFEGNADVWSLSPRFFVVYLGEQLSGPYFVIEIFAKDKRVLIHPLEWFTSEKYDFGYEAPIDVFEMPTQNYLLFAIARRAPVLYDFSKKSVLREVFIGVNNFKFLKQDSEIWATSYNELVKSDSHTLEPILSKVFQRPLKDGLQAGVGDFSFSLDEKYCALARPHSHDILLLETDGMNEITRIKSQHQPFEVVLLDNNECIYRDTENRVLDFKSFSLIE